MSDTLEQTVGEFLAGEYTIGEVWVRLAEEVQDGDQDMALKQAQRVACAMEKESITLTADIYKSIRSFKPALVERGIGKGRF